MRGMLLERGITVSEGRRRFETALPVILDDPDNKLSGCLRVLLTQLRLEMQYLHSQIEEADKLIVRIADELKACRRLVAIPGVGPVVRLTEVFRQAASSKIITNAHLIRQGRLPDLRTAESDSDFHFVERDTPEEIAATLVRLVQARIPMGHKLDPIRDIQVLCPMNRGSIGVRELNTARQTHLNPARPGEHAVERFGWRFRVRDKVIQTENNYKKEVFNGDIGTIKKIDSVEQELFIEFDDRVVAYDFGELDEVSLAYAVTIHKSQGSEFPAVIIPVAMQHYMLLQRNLIYTGITRAKRLLVLVGQRKALGLAVRNDQSRKILGTPEQPRRSTA